MTLREQAQQFIEKYPSVNHVLINRESSNKLVNLYYAMTGIVISCGGCHNQAEVAYNSINNYIRRDSNPDHYMNRNQTPRQFTMNKGAQVYSNTHARFVSDETITDAIALDLIREREQNIEYFSGYPDNYLELISEKQVSEAVVSEPVHVDVEQVDTEVKAEEETAQEQEEKPVHEKSKPVQQNQKHGKNKNRR